MTECEAGKSVHLLDASTAVLAETGGPPAVAVMLSVHQQDVAAKIMLVISASGRIHFEALLLVVDAKGECTHRRFLRALWPA